MSEYVNTDDLGHTFDEWVFRMGNDYPKDYPDGYSVQAEYGWRRLHTDWLISTRSNGTYSQCAFHLCKESWLRADTICRLEGECVCGETVPEDIRMVALLLEAL